MKRQMLTATAVLATVALGATPALAKDGKENGGVRLDKAAKRALHVDVLVARHGALVEFSADRGTITAIDGMTITLDQAIAGNGRTATITLRDDVVIRQADEDEDATTTPMLGVGQLVRVVTSPRRQVVTIAATGATAAPKLHHLGWFKARKARHFAAYFAKKDGSAGEVVVDQGTFVSAVDATLTLELGTAETPHPLEVAVADGATVTVDGAAADLSALVAGMRVRVTTADGVTTVAAFSPREGGHGSR